MIDGSAIEKAVARIIEAIGDDAAREGLKGTPGRVASAYAELFSGIGKNPSEELRSGFEEDHRDMVILRDMPFYSMCEHHFLPFFGTAHLGYLPNGKVVGVSKLARVVDILAKRPQMQERLTAQIADTIFDAVHPDGVAVIISAEHLCMTMRGVNVPGTKVLTLATRGDFKGSIVTLEQLVSIVKGS